MDRSGPSEARVRAAWEAHRSYLLAIAAAMLRRSADAEDVVQEAFARLAVAPVDSLDDVRGWLVVVTRRLCLDRLALAEARRATATANPPEAAGHSVDPADRLTLDDEVRRALDVVVDRLSPAERTSFVLHDIFDFPFGAVAELVGRDPAACRQLARRARVSIRSGPFGADLPGPVPQGGTTMGLANAGVPADKAGLAAALLNASQQVGAALGLAIFTAAQTTRTNHLLAGHFPRVEALTSGFHLPLLLGSIFIAAAAIVGLRATNTKGEGASAGRAAQPEAVLVTH